MRVIIIVPSLLLRYFSFFISLEILRSTWEFLEQNLGNSIKVEWQHWSAVRILPVADPACEHEASYISNNNAKQTNHQRF